MHSLAWRVNNNKVKDIGISYKFVTATPHTVSVTCVRVTSYMVGARGHVSLLSNSPAILRPQQWDTVPSRVGHSMAGPTCLLDKSGTGHDAVAGCCNTIPNLTVPFTAYNLLPSCQLNSYTNVLQTGNSNGRHTSFHAVSTTAIEEKLPETCPLEVGY